jgi:DNA-binding winged helix-turn-helix (wHTH) protein/tetratricopeptide (TPR) repeat protein
MDNAVKHLLEFGPFRLDPEQRLLLREQRSIPLSPKAFDLLLILVQRSGQLVLKDDLMKLLWPDTFVEESNLGQHVFQLRKALGEKAQGSTYIVTVPGRGYRFAQTVRSVSSEESVVVESHTRSTVIIQEAPESQTVSSILSRLGRKPWNWTLGAITLLAVGVVAAGYLHRPPGLKEADLVLVSDFVNTTGEPIFDNTLKQALSVKLAESPFFNVVLDGQKRKTLALMQRSVDERVVPPIAREVCEREGAKALIDGSIMRLGNEYVLGLEAVNCLSGETLAQEKIRVANQEQVLRQLGQVIVPLRRKLGESLASIQKFDTPIEQATTKSLPALKAYTDGDQKRAHSQDAESIPYYKMAIDLDPDFAIAYARLGAVYFNLEQEVLASDYLKKAFERREHISEREKFYIQGHYYEDSAREMDKAIETYKLWTEVYPHDWIPFNNLCNGSVAIGNWEQAVAAGQHALQLNPSHAFPYASLTLAYQWATRFAEAKAVGEKAEEQKLDNHVTHRVLYRIALMEGDEKSAQREKDWSQTSPVESLFMIQNAEYALSLGRIREGSRLFEEARANALAKQPKELAGSITLDEAQYYADLGRYKEARVLSEEALRLMPESSDRRAYAALVFARIGDVARAVRLAQEVSAQSSSDLLMNKVVLACVRSASALSRKDPRSAIAELQQSSPYDFSDPSKGVTAYYRGEAFLQMHDGTQAAAEFQKIIQNRGAVSLPYWALAQLGMARAYAESGDNDKSMSAYRDFLDVWKNADSDVPILREATSEYAKVKGKGLAASN